MDSTLRSNLSVGMPLDMCVIARGACRVGEYRRRRGRAIPGDVRCVVQRAARGIPEDHPL